MRPRPETLGRPARPPAAGLLAPARRLATGTGPLLVGLLLLLAWGLRLDLLDARNLSGEEARLLWFAWTLPPDLGSALGRDLQSPLFVWGLSGWLSLAGSDLLAARLPAALAGLVGVAALVRLGWWAGGPALGLLAGLFLALARPHLGWSQTVGPLALAATVWLLGWLLLRHLPDRPGRALLGYGLAGALAVALAPLMVGPALAGLLGGLLWALAGGRGRRPRLAVAGWGLLAAGLLLAPLGGLAGVGWLRLEGSPAGRSGWRAFGDLYAALLTLGLSVRIEQVRGLAWGLVLLALAGLALAGRWPGEERRRVRGLAGLAVLALGGAAALLGVLTQVPALRAPVITVETYPLALPGYALLLGIVVVALLRRLRPAGLLLALGLAGLSLWTLGDYRAGRVDRDHFLSLGRALLAYARPGEAVVLYPESDWPLFRAAGAGPLPVLHLDARPLPVAERRAEVRRLLASGATGLWVVVNPDAPAVDPERVVLAELGRVWPLRATFTFGSRQLLLYAPAGRDLAPAADFRPLVERRETVAPGLVLLGYDQVVRRVTAGERLTLVLYWRVEAGGAAVRRLRLELIQGEEVLTQRSHPLEAGAGGLVRDQWDLGVPIGTGGEVAVRLRLFDAQDQEVARLALGRLTVVPVSRPPRQSVGPTGQERRVYLGTEIELRGFALSPALDRPLPPGGTLDLTLFWRPLRVPSGDYNVFVQVLRHPAEAVERDRDRLYAIRDQRPVDNTYPTLSWVPGEEVADHYRLTLDPATPPGRYRLLVGLYDRATGQRLPVRGEDGAVLGDALPLVEFRVAP